MSFVRTGDTVIVESISRIARNTRDLLSIITELTEKGVEFVILKENIGTTTPQGRFMLTVFGALAELERENILERQREGIEIAKSEGKYKGRRKMIPPLFLLLAGNRQKRGTSLHSFLFPKSHIV